MPGFSLCWRPFKLKGIELTLTRDSRIKWTVNPLSEIQVSVDRAEKSRRRIRIKETIQTSILDLKKSKNLQTKLEDGTRHSRDR